MRRDPYAQVTLDVGNKTAARAVARTQCLKLHRNAPIVGTRNMGPRRQIARRDCALCEVKGRRRHPPRLPIFKMRGARNDPRRGGVGLMPCIEEATAVRRRVELCTGPWKSPLGARRVLLCGSFQAARRWPLVLEGPIHAFLGEPVARPDDTEGTFSHRRTATGKVLRRRLVNYLFELRALHVP
jgi:hypothetical protein